jgi:thiosulfate reductase cytochrome b subunit
VVTGLLYCLYNDWAAWNWTFLDLRLLALIHLACAFAILAFVIIHVYMTTTGHTLTSHIRAMFSGWEEVEEGEVTEWEVHEKR